MTLRYLSHVDIDKEKWDDCIRKAENSLIYAYTFYLDKLSPRWDALVGDNYEYVMPLTWKRKYRIKYLYQPPFMQQLGVFAKDMSSVPWDELHGKMKNHFKFWEINLNYDTPMEELKDLFHLRRATNFVLPLQSRYEAISNGYHNVFAKNLKRSKRFDLSYKEEKYEECILLSREYYSNRVKHLSNNDYNNFLNACIEAEKRDMIICRKVVDNAGQTHAAILMLFDGKRLYNIINVTTKAGKETEANRFLIDSVIQEFAGRNIILDLEGSEIPGVRFFYEQLGSIKQYYYKTKYNGLPALIRWVKR